MSRVGLRVYALVLAGLGFGVARDPGFMMVSSGSRVSWGGGGGV